MHLCAVAKPRKYAYRPSTTPAINAQSAPSRDPHRQRQGKSPKKHAERQYSMDVPGDLALALARGCRRRSATASDISVFRECLYHRYRALQIAVGGGIMSEQLAAAATPPRILQCHTHDRDQQRARRQENLHQVGRGG